MTKITQRIQHVAIALTNQVEEFATLHHHTNQRAFEPEIVDSQFTTEPAKLLDWVSRRFLAAGEGVLVVDRVPVHVFDDGDDRAQLRAFAEAVKPHGWDPGDGIKIDKGWITWLRDGSPAVHMCVRRMLDQDPMVSIGDAIESVLERLCRYAHLTYGAYHATPGVSGLGVLRNLYNRPRLSKPPGMPPRWVKRAQPLWVWRPPLDMSAWGAGTLSWQRKPTPAERRLSLVVPFDVRAARLAAAGHAMLAWDAPTNTGAISWEPSLAGFWRIIAGGRPWADPRKGLPIVNPDRIMSDGTAWVTSPIIRGIDKFYPGQRPEILDSWTAPGKPLLQPWVAQLRDAAPAFQAAGDPILEEMIKATYTESFGMMKAPGGRVYRTDWYATVVDEERYQFLLKTRWSDGPTPLKVVTDCAYYATDGDDLGEYLARFGHDPAAHEGDAKIGHMIYKSEKVVTMGQWLAAQGYGVQ